MENQISNNLLLGQSMTIKTTLSSGKIRETNVTDDATPWQLACAHTNALNDLAVHSQIIGMCNGHGIRALCAQLENVPRKGKSANPDFVKFWNTNAVVETYRDSKGQARVVESLPTNRNTLIAFLAAFLASEGGVIKKTGKTAVVYRTALNMVIHLDSDQSIATRKLRDALVDYIWLM
jgi:hypothetical protein